MPTSPTARASARIDDNDPDPPVSIDDVSVTEGDAGVTQATFTVSLAGSSVKTVTVDYATQSTAAPASRTTTRRRAAR